MGQLEQEDEERHDVHPFRQGLQVKVLVLKYCEAGQVL